MKKNNILFVFAIAGALVAGSFEAKAQFFYDEPGKNSTGMFQLDGNGVACYTGIGSPANMMDNVGQGWIRLTNNGKNKLGYVILDRTFPTTMGVTVEFDFKVWGYFAGHAISEQADGFSVFLIDATKAAGPFTQGGAVGGGLGFASGLTNSNPADTIHGARPTYLGVGIDEHGNFSNSGAPNSVMIGGLAGKIPHTIALRTGSIQAPSNRYRYLRGTSGGLQWHSGLLPETTSYSAPAQTTSNIQPPNNARPTDADCYRRVRINFDPLDNKGVKVTAYLKVSTGGDFVKLFEHHYTQSTAGAGFTPRPDTMRVGFSATTGDATAFHEVRNVLIRTPGVVQVVKQPVECPEVGVAKTIQTTIACFTTGRSITVKDTLPEGYTVTSGPTIISEGSGVGGTFSSISSTQIPGDGRWVYTYTINMGANSGVHVTYAGQFSSMPAGGQFTTSAAITNINPTINDPGIQILYAKYVGAMKHIAPLSPASTTVSYVRGTQMPFSVSAGGDVEWESSTNGLTWSYAGSGNPFTPSATLFAGNAFQLRCTAGTGNCTVGPLVYNCTAVFEPEIVLADSCSLRPYLTVKYRYAGATYQWFRSPATGAASWTPINGATDVNLYITDEARYRVEVTHKSLTGVSQPVRLFVKPTKLQGNLWWYECQTGI